MKLSITSFLLAIAIPTCSGFAPKSSSYHKNPVNVRYASLFEENADRLFAKFDVDNNGTIDKEEFRAIAKKMRVDSSRREIISVATAVCGSFAVATSSDTLQ